MSLLTRGSLIGAMCGGLLLASGSAWAAVQCPPSSDGHGIRALEGGTLYEGRIADNAMLAPSGTQSGPDGWVNIWRFMASPDVTLICRYEGIAAPVRVGLTPDIRTCRQDARSFVCR